MPQTQERTPEFAMADGAGRLWAKSLREVTVITQARRSSRIKLTRLQADRLEMQRPLVKIATPTCSVGPSPL